MKPTVFLTIGLLIAVNLFAQHVPSGDKHLFYRKPAAQWLEALPLGNGSLGAMVFGGTATEQIQFNESTLCTGTTDKIGAYQPFGNLFIQLNHSGVREYSRQLSLDDAMQTVSYQVGETRFKREYFVSKPNHALIVRLTSSARRALSARITLKSEHADRTWLQNNQLGFNGALENGIKYAATVKAVSAGGKISLGDTSITIRNADTITIFLVANTSFKPFSGLNFLGNEDPRTKNQLILDRLPEGNYLAMKDRHIKDYQSFFKRMDLKLHSDQNDMFPETDERVKRYATGHTDNQLEALLFNYGRYLFISSSRPDGVPANLQGIWNKDLKPAWYSQYTTNINIQMNYWLSGSTNLS